MYDVTRGNSFKGLKRWHEELSKHAPKTVSNITDYSVKIVVGNKIDLLEEGANEEVPE